MLKGMNRYLRYSIIYVGIMIALAALNLLLIYTLEWGIGGGTSAVLPLVMGLMVGQWYLEDDGPVPTSKERWVDAVRFGLLGTAISGLIGLFILFFVAPVALVGLAGSLIVLIFMAVIFILSTRLGIWLGVRTTLNAQALKAGK